jgi:hypothetical protein
MGAKVTGVFELLEGELSFKGSIWPPIPIFGPSNIHVQNLYGNGIAPEDFGFGCPTITKFPSGIRFKLRP